MQAQDESHEPRGGRFCPTHLAVYYAEVALKGRNRAWFENVLVRNLRRALTTLGKGSGDAPPPRVTRLYGRILVSPPEGVRWETSVRILTRVFGVAYVLPVVRVEPPELDALLVAAEAVLPPQGSARTFAVKCRRATKDFPFDSMEVQRRLGARIRERTGWAVDLDNPDCTVRVECVNRQVYVGRERFAGPGGMPTGVTGQVACLISGGIDSPVAAYRILRRGAPLLFVHFHSYPHTGAESQEKVKELVGRVLPPGARARLWLVPFAELQRGIAARCAASLRVLLYRRFMFRVAEVLARREGAIALVTGENLGQVASQTLENIAAIEGVASMPILRPLIGLDKQEIVAEARRIGTFATSIEPHGDCCSFLMPPNPATHATSEVLATEETRLDVSAEVSKLVEASAAVEIASAPAEDPRPVDVPESLTRPEGETPALSDGMGC